MTFASDCDRSLKPGHEEPQTLAAASDSGRRSLNKVGNQDGTQVPGWKMGLSSGNTMVGKLAFIWSESSKKFQKEGVVEGTRGENQEVSPKRREAETAKTGQYSHMCW